ncbi:hypothetical protein FBU30_008931, partial [Linnemannia zychae]
MFTATQSIYATQEVTLKVVSPQLENTSGNTCVLSYTRNANWEVNLYRSFKLLTIDIIHRTYYWDNFRYVSKLSMSIFNSQEADYVYHGPVDDSALCDDNHIKCTVPVEEVTKDDMLDFEIVLYLVYGSPRELRTSTCRQIDEPEKSTSSHSDILPLLLKDANSVDVCFTFNSDNTHSNITVWAHRVVLTRHKVFADLIQNQETIQSLLAVTQTTKAESDIDTSSKFESDSESSYTISVDDTSTTVNTDTRILVIQVDKLSLEAFCTALYYIYTGEIRLSFDSTRFAISFSQSKANITRDYELRTLTKKPSTLKFKDVTWGQLLEAADLYKILDLQDECLRQVISGMNQSNVVETLFYKTPSGTEVRQAGM